MIEFKDLHLESSKNTDISKWHFTKLKPGLKVVEFSDQSEGKISLGIEKKIVQYFFCINGKINFSFHDSSYKIALKEGEIFFFYNPTERLTPIISTSSGTKLVMFFSTLEEIHNMFLDNAQSLKFLLNGDLDKKYYKKDIIGSEMNLVLNQMIETKVSGSAKDVFKYAKVLEVFSLYFSKQAEEDKESCPFLNDETSVKKIRKAKDILIAKMADPPMISELASEVELNEFRLKEGFKSMYGTTMFAFLLNEKMHKGKSMLDSGKYKVQDVAYQLGYNNPSHFITAFKNKFSLTPKKYLQNS